MKRTAFQPTRYFFLLAVALLIVFAIGSLLRIPANPGQAFLHRFYAVAMFGDAAAMLVCVWLLHKRMKFAFQTSFLVLALNILPTIFDQFGLVDLLFVMFNLITLGVLIAARNEFLPA